MMLQQTVVPRQNVQIEGQPAEGKAQDDGNQHAHPPSLALQQKKPSPFTQRANRFPAPEKEANVQVAVGGDANGQHILRREGVQGEVNARAGALKGVDLAAGQGANVGRQVVDDDAAVLRVGKAQRQRGGPHAGEDGPGGQAAPVGAE